MCLKVLICAKGVILMNSKHITNYKPKDFAELLGVSVKTLQRWDRENILKAKRTPTDRRYYTYEQYLEFKGINGSDNDRKTIIYTRVSTNGQKDDLKNQIEFLLNFTSSKANKSIFMSYYNRINFISHAFLNKFIPFSTIVIQSTTYIINYFNYYYTFGRCKV